MRDAGEPFRYRRLNCPVLVFRRREWRHGRTGRRYVQTRPHGACSSFWPHEVLNALLAGEKRKRISKKLAQSFLEVLALLSIELERFDAGTVFNRIRSLSREHGLTAYDAVISISRWMRRCHSPLWTKI